jgi:hypothetical protein
MGEAGCAGTPDVGPILGLPKLPVSEIVLFGRSGTPLKSEVLRALSASVRSALK